MKPDTSFVLKSGHFHLLTTLTGSRSSDRNKEFEQLPRRIENWSPISLQQRLTKTGGRLVKHASFCWLSLAESHLTRRLFGSILRRMEGLPPPAV
jgi:hypothetical protein